MNFPFGLTVLLWCLCAVGFSESGKLSTPQASSKPMGDDLKASPGTQRRSDTPPRREMDADAEGVREEQEDPVRTVLEVKYEGGLVQEVRVSQGAPMKAPPPPQQPRPPLQTQPPSLDGRHRYCSELCRAGFGGKPCGENCTDQVPTDFLEIWNNNSPTKNNIAHPAPKFSFETNQHNNSLTSKELDDKPTKIIGRPRSEVCPVLCANNLGQPICDCNRTKNKDVNWKAVCDTFCFDGHYRLEGCPECHISSTKNPNKPLKSNNMEEIWIEWCNYQCQKGEGGAACNCDLAPLSLNMETNHT